MKVLNFRFLAEIADGQNSLAAQIYARLEQELRSQRLRTPLLPFVSEAPDPQVTKWEFTLRKSLGLADKDAKIQLCALLDGANLKVTRGGSILAEISLARKGTILRTLDLLAQSAVGPLPKSYLHVGLTRSKYVSELHDGRINRLLHRLRKIFEERNLPAPVELPGGNQLLLRYPIRRIDS